jgi:hypothetical protein
LEVFMLSKLTGVAIVALTATIGAGALSLNEAAAKGRCATGQILRVSSGTCVSRSFAVEQGIVGGKRRAQAEFARKNKAGGSQQARAETDGQEDAQGTTTVSRTSSEPVQSTGRARPTRQMVSDARSASEPSAGSTVRIEVVKTEPRPTPAILMPTWPYGELAAFPKRLSP